MTRNIESKLHSEPISNPGEITDELFSQIHNDAYITGTRTLEGNTMTNTLKFMREYITTCKKDKISNELYAKISACLSLTEEIKNYSYVGIDAINTTDKRQEILKKLAKDIYQNCISKLYIPGSPLSTLMPGGWSSSNAHAMLYEFKKDELDNLIFVIHNSGGGLQHHLTQSDLSHNRTCPVKVYKIPKKIATDAEQMEPFLKKLINAQTEFIWDKIEDKKNREYNADRLYNEVIDSIIFHGGELIDPLPYTKQDAYTKGQKSGTCAEKCMHSMIESSLPDKKTYKRFMFGLKKYSLSKYTDQVKQKEQNKDHIEPGVYRQINMALSNMARMLNNAKNLGLNKNEKQQELSKLKELKKHFKIEIKQIKKIQPNATELNALQIPGATIHDIGEISATQVAVPITVGAKAVPDKTIKHKILGLNPDVSLLGNIANIVQKCKKLEQEGEYIVLLAQIDKLLLDLPLPPDLKAKTAYQEFNSPEKLKKILDNLKILKTMYDSANTRHYKDELAPQTVVAQLSFIAILNNIASAAPYKVTINNDLPLFDITKAPITRLLHRTAKNPFLGTNDYSYDKRLEQIRKMYGAEMDGNNPHAASFFNYYKQIIRKNPKLIQFLEDEFKKNKKLQPVDPYEANALIQDGYASICAFYKLNSSPQLKQEILGNIPEALSDFNKVQADFAIQKQYEDMMLKSWESITVSKGGLKPTENEFYYSVRPYKFPRAPSNLYISLNEATIKPVLDYTKQTCDPSILTPLERDKFYETYSAFKHLEIKSQFPGKQFSDNDVQMQRATQDSGGTAAESKLLRKLYNLRSSSSGQFMGTIDFFTNNLHYLDDPNCQMYLEKNIFQPGIMLKELEKNHTAVCGKIKNFVDNGVEHFSKNKIPGKQVPYFYKIAFLQSRYTRDSLKENNDRLLDLLEKINQQILNCKDPSIKTELYKQKMLIAVDQLKQQSIVEPTSDLVQSALEAHLFLNFSYAKDPDPLIDRELVRATYNFKVILGQNIVNIPKLLEATLPKVNLDFASKKIIYNGNYPEFSCYNSEGKPMEYKVDVSTGKIYKKDLGLALIPAYIFTEPLFQEIIGADINIGCCSEDNKTFEVSKKGEKFRIIYKGEQEHLKSAITIQKEFTIMGKTQWYELQAIGTNQKERSKYLDSFSGERLPAILKERDNQAWAYNPNGASDNAQMLIVDKNTSKIKYCCKYCHTSKGHRLIDVNNNGDETGYSMVVSKTSVSQLYKLLSTFEDPELIEVLNHIDPEHKPQCIIKLPRYNIELHAIKESDGSWAITLSGTNYTLCQGEQDTVIKGFDVPLKFEQKKNGKTNPIIILPVQQFMLSPEEKEEKEEKEDKHKASKNPQTEYFTFVTDTSGSIQEQLLRKKYEDPTQPKNKQKIPLWQYSGQEKVIKYKLNSNNEPIPSTPADSLYLAYVYLCRHQPDAAFKVLDQCATLQGGLVGTPQEIEYLNWIINSVPANLDEISAKAQPKSPEVLAVKLKSLYMLSNFKQQGAKVTFTSGDSVQANSLDNYIQAAANIDEQIKFYTDLDKTIYELYSEYHKTRDNVPHKLELSDHEQLVLLRNYHMNQQNRQDGLPKTRGAIGVQWRKLEINLLKKELAQLQNRPSQAAIVRIKEIKDILTKDKDVYDIRVDLKERELLVSLPDRFAVIDMKASEFTKYNPSIYPDVLLNTLLNVNQGVRISDGFSQAVGLLSSASITEDQFVENFKYFYELARSEKIEHKQNRDILITCLRNVIIANRNINDDKKVSNIADFCKMLYCVSQQPLEYENILTAQNSLLCDANKMELAKTSLNNIFNKASQSKFKLDIMDYVEVKDEKLISSKEIAANISMPSKQKIKAENIKLKSMVDILELDAVAEFSQKYSEIEVDLESALKKTVRKSKPKSQNTFVKRMLARAAEDTKAGEIINEHTGLKNKLAKKSLTDEQLDNIVSKSIFNIKQLTMKKNELTKKIVELINKGPADSSDKLNWKLQRLGGKKSAINMRALLRLYMANDIHEYKQVTGLSEEQIQQLHSYIQKYLIESVQKQQLRRVKGAIKLVKAMPVGEEKDNALSIVAEKINAKNVVGSQDDPALMVFQYYENMLIRPQQLEYIKKLLEENPNTDVFNNKIMQMIMGGGKSKVLLPLLALKKANGTNLSVIEVPGALFETNFTDLNNTSQRLFGQRACKFEFARGSDSDSLSLKKIYRNLTEVIANRGYIVTTGESSQSLHLKYLELLNSKPEEEKDLLEWKKRIKWLERIVKLFKQRGDVLIDEVDSSLDVKKQLNYTVGTSQVIPKAHIKTVMNVYASFENVKLDGLSGLDGKTLADVVKNNQIVANEEQWDNIFVLLAKHIATNKKTLFKDIVKEKNIDEFLEYILNRTDDIPQFIKSADKKTQDTSAILKEQLNNLLPLTLKRKLHEHYGPSKDSKRSASASAIAIPYAGNNTPNEKCKFGNHFEAMNYSIQLIMNEGLSLPLLTKLVKEWQEEERQAIKQAVDHVPPPTSIYKLFEKDNYQLNLINPENKTQMQELHDKFKNNKKLIYYCLENHILKQIPIDAQVLQSNAQNHISGYRSVQGVTGTPWNYKATMRNAFDPSISKGTDGITINKLISKKTQVQAIAYSSPRQFMQNSAKNVRAIIDIGAMFKGQANKDVAIEIAQHCAESMKSIKFVLFFNDANELCALEVAKPNNVVFIGSSQAEVIAEKLGCTPDERFTYYDQRHTIGTDILQGVNAKALATVDKTTMTKDLLQGVMRMRGLASSQSIELVVPQEIGDVTIEKLLALTNQNQNNRLGDDHFRGVLQKIDNVVRECCLGKIIAEPDPEKKTKLYSNWKDYFSHGTSDEVFLKFGTTEKQKSTAIILAEKKKKVLESLTVNKVDITSDLFDKISGEIDNIIKYGLRDCTENNFFRNQDNTNTEVEAQVQAEVQQEVELEQEEEMEMQQQKEIQNEAFGEGKKSKEFNKWLDNVNEYQLTICPELNSKKYTLWANEVGDNIKQFCISRTGTGDQWCFWMVSNDQSKTIKQVPLSSEQYRLLNIYLENKDPVNKLSLMENIVAGLGYPVLSRDFLVNLTHGKYTEPKVEFKTLENIVNTTVGDKRDWSFDDTIIASQNFYQTYEGQEKFLDLYQKTVEFALMIQTSSGLKTVIVTPQEVEKLSVYLKTTHSSANENIWLVTTSGSTLAGNPPDKEKVHPNFNRTLEQLKFFNGEYSSLVDQPEGLTWMLDHRDDKLKFNNDHILPYRIPSSPEIEVRNFKNLRKRCNKTYCIYKKIIELNNIQKSDDLDWETLLPESSPEFTFTKGDCFFASQCAKHFASSDEYRKEIKDVVQNKLAKITLEPATTQPVQPVQSAHPRMAPTPVQFSSSQLQGKLQPYSLSGAIQKKQNAQIEKPPAPGKSTK